jgi:alpha-tubulin suppressor-like RCC1 family protein
MNLRSSFSSYAVHSVFLADNGKLYSWGPDNRCCLGQFVSTHNSDEPKEMTTPELYRDGGFKDFATGEHHNLLLTNKSRIFVWGRNEDGQLGLGHDKDVETPTPIPNFPDNQIPARVHCGAHFSVVLTEDGLVYTMGYNSSGQLGIGKGLKQYTPTKVNIPTPVVEITCGWSFVLAITRSGQVFGWGLNDDQPLGFSTPTEVYTPILCPSITGFTHIQAGPFHAAGLQDGGALATWGTSAYPGQEEASPYLVIPKGCKDIATGYYTSYASMQDGSFFSWGENIHGQLGNGMAGGSEGLQQVVFPPEWKSRVAFFGSASDHSFVISEEGDLYLWGSGENGRLGMGPDYRQRETPTLLPDWKWELPKSAHWVKVFRWLFLGKQDTNSPFNLLHIEILFHLVTIY